MPKNFEKIELLKFANDYKMKVRQKKRNFNKFRENFDELCLR
jgi:hypothetical protein